MLGVHEFGNIIQGGLGPSIGITYIFGNLSGILVTHSSVLAGGCSSIK